MRSALYFPHTEIRDAKFLRNSLLLWDRIEYIVPWPYFPTQYDKREFREAIEIACREHYPTDEEKTMAHEAIEQFVENGLPDGFYYGDRQDTGATSTDNDFEMFRKKLLPSTWDLLRDRRLRKSDAESRSERGETNAHVVTAPTGLAMMSILADCCAGESLSRITDRGTAYAAIADILGQNQSVEPEALVSVSLRLSDIDDIPLASVVDFRRREQIEADGSSLTALRHRLLDDIEKYVAGITNLIKGEDKINRIREFECDMRIDTFDLRRELRSLNVDTVTSKEVIISTLAIVTAGVGVLHGIPIETLAPFTLPGIGISIGGYISSLNKYSASRASILRKHPMAYVHQLKYSRKKLRFL